MTRRQLYDENGDGDDEDGDGDDNHHDKDEQDQDDDDVGLAEIEWNGRTGNLKREIAEKMLRNTCFAKLLKGSFVFIC